MDRVRAAMAQQTSARNQCKRVMMAFINAIGAPVRSAAVRHSVPSPAAICFSPGAKKKKLRRLTVGIASAVSGEDTGSLLTTALAAASIRFEETFRPDALFIDPYAGCLCSSDESSGEKRPVSSALVSPCHYRIATKFIDDKLLSLMSNNEELRQIVLLTDGMDTRPYRLKWPHSCVIFDISPGNVFEVASKRLKGIGAKISKSCIFLHVPLEFPDLQAILCEKGFNGNRPSLWVLQGQPVMASASLKSILCTISSLAMKGSAFVGTLPGWLLQDEFGKKSTAQGMEKLFMSHGFQVEVFDFDEIATSMCVVPPSRVDMDVLFLAKQLRLSDAQMENWWTHFHRLEEEADEEGFEEL